MSLQGAVRAAQRLPPGNGGFQPLEMIDPGCYMKVSKNTGLPCWGPMIWGPRKVPIWDRWKAPCRDQILAATKVLIKDPCPGGRQITSTKRDLTVGFPRPNTTGNTGSHAIDRILVLSVPYIIYHMLYIYI